MSLREFEKCLYNAGGDLEKALTDQARVLEKTTEAMRRVNIEVAEKEEILFNLRVKYQELLGVPMSAKSDGGSQAGSSPTSVAAGPSVISSSSSNLSAIQTSDGVRADPGIMGESGGDTQADSSPSPATDLSLHDPLSTNVQPIQEPDGVRADTGITEESGSGAQAGSPPPSVTGPPVSSLLSTVHSGTGIAEESSDGARAGVASGKVSGKPKSPCRGKPIPKCLWQWLLSVVHSMTGENEFGDVEAQCKGSLFHYQK